MALKVYLAITVEDYLVLEMGTVNGGGSRATGQLARTFWDLKCCSSNERRDNPRSAEVVHEPCEIS